MTLTSNKTRTALLSSLAAVLALGAAEAYAADNVAVETANSSRIWVYTKTAVTETAAVEIAEAPSSVLRRTEPLPDLVVPLNTDVTLRATPTSNLAPATRTNAEFDLRNFDLLEDQALFIGAQSSPEFDALDVQRGRAAYPNSLGVDPLVPVAGAGLATAF